jgi:hypothetical protein
MKNTNLKSIHISKDLHYLIKCYTTKNNLNIKDWIETQLNESLDREFQTVFEMTKKIKQNKSNHK